MNKTGYEELTKKLGITNVPESFKTFYDEWDGRGHFLDKDELWEIIGRYEISEAQKAELETYLEELKKNELVTEYIKFLTYAQCDRRYEYYITGETDFDPKNIGEAGKAVTFFMCLSCIGHAKKDLERRGVPYALYEDIPHRMLRMHMKKYAETGSYVMNDLPWQSNFYSLSIYLFDRFLFVPCKMDDPYTFYRKGKEVIGIPEDGLPVDCEGQIILQDENVIENTGKKAEITEDDNPIKDGHYYGAFKKDRKQEFVTTKTETDDEVTGYRLSPCGFITKEKVTLKKNEWKKILQKDDWMLGFHIPSGEGYVPERVRKSMKLAHEFFEKYYPEIQFKGFWSSSWLYDGRLSILLPDESNIVRVQRQFYNYSGGWNGEMLYIELYGKIDLLLEDVPQKSSLQRNVKKYLESGRKFSEPGMVYFFEELEKDYNQMIYITQNDLEQQEKMFEENGLKGGF